MPHQPGHKYMIDGTNQEYFGKVVKLTPTDKDDIVFDMVIKPVWDKLPFGKK